MIDQAAITAFILANPVAAGVAGGAIFLGALASAFSQPPKKRTARRLRREPLPVARPKKMEPKAARVTGHGRRLAERQQAWIEAAALAGDVVEPVEAGLTAADVAFADWFHNRIIIPKVPTIADVITQADWETDYTDYCDKHGSERLFGEDLMQHMHAYAKADNCTLGSMGELNGGHLDN